MNHTLSLDLVRRLTNVRIPLKIKQANKVWPITQNLIETK
jgi:hypothetical protein